VITTCTVARHGTVEYVASIVVVVTRGRATIPAHVYSAVAAAAATSTATANADAAIATTTAAATATATADTNATAATLLVYSIVGGSVWVYGV
jgi:microcystin-dependent protein